MDYLTRLLRKNGSSNQGDKTIVEVDDSSTCGGKSETESPASSTPSRLDTTTDDYESADEGPSTPSREVNLSVLASQLETLTIGTPQKLASVRPGVIFPYSPIQETSVLLSSPEKEEDDPLDKTIGVSPIPVVDFSSPVESNGVLSSQNNQLEPVFKVPVAVVKKDRYSLASTATGFNDDTFYTADTSFWSPSLDRSAVLAKFSEETVSQNLVRTPDAETRPSDAIASEQPTSPEVTPESEHPFGREALGCTPKADDISATGVSPIPVVDCLSSYVPSPEECNGTIFAQNNQSGTVFKVPGAVVKQGSHSSASTTGNSDGTVDSIWSPPVYLDATVTEDALNQKIVGTPRFINDSNSSQASASGHCASPEINKFENLCKEEILNNTTNTEDLFLQSSEVKSAVSDFIAHADKITLREDSPLASSIQERSYDEDLNLSLAPAQIDVDQTVLKRHSTGFCKKEILFTSEAVVERHSFPEKLHEFEVNAVLESPNRRRSSTNYFLNVRNSASTENLSETTDFSAFAKEVVDSCVDEATSKCQNQNPSAESSTTNGDVSTNAGETEENCKLDEVCEGSSVMGNANCEIPMKDTVAVDADDLSESTVRVINSHQADLPGKDESLRDPAGLSFTQIPDDYSNGEVSLNSEESVSNNNTVIENDAVNSSNPNQEHMFSLSSDNTSELHANQVEGAVETVGIANLPSENAEPQEESLPLKVVHVEYTSVSPSRDTESQVLGTVTSGVDVVNSSNCSPVVVASSAVDKQEAEVNIPRETPSLETTEVTVPSEQVSNAANPITLDSDNLTVPSSSNGSELHEVKQVVAVPTNNVSVEEKTAASPIAEPMPSMAAGVLPLKCIGVEDNAVYLSPRAVSKFLKNPSPSDVMVDVVTSSIYTDGDVIAHDADAATGANNGTENVRLAELPCDVAESELSASVDAVRPEKVLSLPDKIGVMEVESSTDAESQLPGTTSEDDSNVGVVTSNKCDDEHVGQSAEESKGAVVLNTVENAEVTCLSEDSSANLQSPVHVAVTNNSLGDEKCTNSSEPTNQACEFSQSGVSAGTVGTEDEFSSSPKTAVDLAQIGNVTELPSQLPGIFPKADPDTVSSVVVDFGKTLPTLSESNIVLKNEPSSDSSPENKTLKRVDFASLSGVQGNAEEQDLAAESINFYSSPESTVGQCTSDGKSDAMEQSYKDLSKLLATCSKQEQELGSRTFDFGCIQAEAAKIACDIIHLNDTKSSDQTQPMMQSSLSAEANNSEAGPVTADEDINREEFFNDASALDFEYLARAGNNQRCLSKLSRQSLFVKFDPLVGQLIASSENPDSSLITAMADHNQSSGEEGKLDVTPPSHSEGDERLIPITPATTKKEHRQSAGGHTPSLRQEISKLQELMIQQEQAHQEKADLVEELRSRIAELEATDNHRDSGDLEKKLKHKDDDLRHALDELEKAKGSNRQLIQVMEEYEKTISQLVTVKEETKAQMEKEKETIASERDTALQHLSNMEVAFNDIHQKYERAKTVIETLHANEKELKKSYDAAVETVEAQKVAYLKLKQHAAEKLTAANAEIEKVHKEYNGEMARMKAVAKKNELKCKSLEESLEQKKNELRELTQICDELIANHTPS